MAVLEEHVCLCKVVSGWYIDKKISLLTEIFVIAFEIYVFIIDTESFKCFEKWPLFTAKSAGS